MKSVRKIYIVQNAKQLQVNVQVVILWVVTQIYLIINVILNARKVICVYYKINKIIYNLWQEWEKILQICNAKIV